MQTLQQLRSGQLAGITRLKLSCELTEFPQEIFDLAETLEILDLSVNQLTHLPDNFGQLKKLKIVFLSENNFTEFPKVLCDCLELDIVGFKANIISFITEDAIPVSLRWLILTNNRIEQLPGSIGKCVKLQKVMLAGNRLKQLPVEMAACKNIELLRISANNIEELPTWLFSLPRLSWLAYAGNPCSKNGQIKNDLNEISWSEFELQEQLGEGASGIITKAVWKNKESGNSEKHVAVKVFKGEVTSDGLPEDEMNACMTAGNHPHLVQLLGKIIDHPQQKQGLVFDLIPPTFKNLSGPPDFKTCTRDTFKEGTTFSIRQIVAISSGIASAAGHLHQKGLMHGDLYAHNTLIDENAYPLFGDFGAATPYDLSDKLAVAVERIEVRAFGCLLDDLLLNITLEDKNTSAGEILIKLKQDCMTENIASRPNFMAIHKIITSIQK